MGRDVITVLLGGAVGAAWRESLILAVAGLPGGFPMPIFVANMTASLLIGLVAGTISRGVHVSPRSRLFLMTGFLGGLSSFSSLVLGTDQMLADPTQRLTAVAYLLGSMVIGLGLTIAGIRLGRRQNVAARRP